MPIPSTDLAGHAIVRARIEGAFELLMETRAVEFKQSAPWESLKGHMVRTCMAMSNLRDGGVDYSWCPRKR